MSDRKNSLNEIEREKILFDSYSKKQKLEEEAENKCRINNDPINQIEWVKEKEESVTFEVAKHCVLKRDFLTKNIYKPFFSQVKGCFVRMSFPNGYGICKILDITYGNDYEFDIGGRKFRIDRYLHLKHGDNEIDIPVAMVSNSDIEEEEFNKIKRYEFNVDIMKDFIRVCKLFERGLNKEEQRKFEDSKRQFMCNTVKRLCHFKNDLVRKKRDAIHDRKRDLVKELVIVIRELENVDKPLRSKEVNELGRKYSLRVPGGEIDKIEIIKVKDK